MSIVFLSRLYWPHVGGVEKHLKKINQYLNSKGYKVIIVCEKHDPILSHYEIKNSIEIYRIPSGDKLTVWIWWLRHLDLLINADIIHIHDVFWWFLPFRFILPTKRVYMTFHGYEGTEPPKWNQIFWHRLAALLTRGNICIGDFHRKWYGVKPDYISYGAV